MTHSFNKTLLASLGFSDKDKKDKRHDLAIQYLEKSKVQSRIVESIAVSPQTTKITAHFIEQEKLISKGDGKYKTTIGFVDAILKLWLVREDIDQEENKVNILVEVKINPVSVGDIIRQIRLYSEYSTDYTPYSDFVLGSFKGNDKLWLKYYKLLITCFDFSKEDVRSLEDAGIFPIRLGKDFEEFVKAQQEEPKANLTEI